MFVLAGLVVSVLLLTTVWATRYSWSKRRPWKLGKKIPGPMGWPILGNSLSLTGSSRETFETFLDWVEKYGTTLRFWIGPKLYVCLTDPMDLQIILGNQRIRNRDVTFSLAMKAFFGVGLFSNRDDTWRLHRKLITPAFHFKLLESYVQIFARKAEILTEELRDLADGRTTDISHQLSMCTLDAICETTFGVNMNIQSEGNSEFGKALQESISLIHNRAVHPWLLIDWLYPWTSDGRQAKGIILTIQKFSEDVIASKRESYKKENTERNSSDNEKHICLLDMFIETSSKRITREKLSSVEIRDEVKTLAFAGMETTSTTMAYALVLLGMYPEYQDKIEEELASIFQGETRTPTSEDLHKMKFLEHVIKETLRLFPAVTIMPREITQDMEISNGYILPAGCSVMCISYAIHHNPAYYPDPEKFYPERWTPENSVGRHPYAFLPFGAGPRNCIGKKYAMLAMKAILSSLLRQYRFTCDCYTMKDLAQLEMSVTVRSAVGYKLQIHKKD